MYESDSFMADPFNIAICIAGVCLVLFGIAVLFLDGPKAQRERLEKFEVALRAAQESEPALKGMVIEEIDHLFWNRTCDGALVCQFTVVGSDDGRPNRVRMRARLLVHNGEWIVRDVYRYPPDSL